MRFSRSTHLLTYLPLETLTSIIRTSLPISVELIDLVNTVIVFVSQTALLMDNLPTRISDCDSHNLLFSIYLFLFTLVFVVQWLSLHWEILIMLLPQFPLTFHHIHNGMSHFITWLMIILVLIGMVFVITWEMFHRGYL